MVQSFPPKKLSTNNGAELLWSSFPFEMKKKQKRGGKILTVWAKSQQDFTYFRKTLN